MSHGCSCARCSFGEVSSCLLRCRSRSPASFIHCDLPWNPAKLEQRIARAWRKHQKNAVTVLNLIAADTIEHRMLGTLDAKCTLAEGVLDLKGALDEVPSRPGGQSFLQGLEQTLSAAPAAGSQISNLKSQIPDPR
jgi:hypothetical protein